MNEPWKKDERGHQTTEKRMSADQFAGCVGGSKHVAMIRVDSLSDVGVESGGLEELAPPYVSPTCWV